MASIAAEALCAPWCWSRCWAPTRLPRRHLRRADMQLTVELTPDVPDPQDAGFLSSLLSNQVNYRLTMLRERDGSVIVLELTGPAPRMAVRTWSKQCARTGVCCPFECTRSPHRQTLTTRTLSLSSLRHCRPRRSWAWTYLLVDLLHCTGRPATLHRLVECCFRSNRAMCSRMLDCALSASKSLARLPRRRASRTIAALDRKHTLHACAGWRDAQYSEANPPTGMSMPNFSAGGNGAADDSDNVRVVRVCRCG